MRKQALLRTRPAVALLVALAAAIATPARAVPPSAPPVALEPSADGRELLDRSTGQAWARCVEGMAWDGRACTGQATLFTHGEALAKARARSAADGQAWRVPRVTELKHFVVRQSRAPQPQDAGSPAGWYWTSTARIESESVNPYAYRNVQRGATETQSDRLIVQQGWAVDGRSGEARGDMPKRQRLPLRLVRSLAP